MKPPPADGVAIVFGASGGIGSAIVAVLERDGAYLDVASFSRSGEEAVDLTSEAAVAGAARRVSSAGLPIRLIVNATGFLHGDGFTPEKSWRQIDPSHMARAFAVNAIGPALLMKHFLPILPREGRSVFATLSAKVGSIGDNRTGGWYSYRSSKAALNQLVRTASIELGRRNPEAICVALHPGTVDTRLSKPFGKQGLDVRSPSEAAEQLLTVIAGLTPADSGEFVDYRGNRLPW